MPNPMTANDVLDREYLEVRSRILDIAAALDRIDRAADAPRLQDDARMTRLRRALETLLKQKQDRAEAVQIVFSDAYQEGWRAQ